MLHPQRVTYWSLFKESIEFVRIFYPGIWRLHFQKLLFQNQEFAMTFPSEQGLIFVNSILITYSLSVENSSHLVKKEEVFSIGRALEWTDDTFCNGTLLKDSQRLAGRFAFNLIG